jgi:peptidoglycan hydrolase-like protein with peptidoglycan-binding domain
VLTTLILLLTTSPASGEVWPGDHRGTPGGWPGVERYGAAAAPVTGAPGPVSTGARPGRDRSRASGRVVLPPAPATDSWSGYAFDACRAPSRRVMDRWRVTSPFHGVGIYIGGALRACAQRHLTRGWVRHQVEHGWKLLPIWVGPQASCTSYSRTIPSRAGARHRYPAARALAAREARRAARAAQDLGIVRGSTLWYDLEWFPSGRPACRASALHFLSAWTDQVHRRGYRSGVYSSVSAGIAALGSVRGNGRFTKPDRLWFAWHNWRRDVRWDEYVDAPTWRQRARVHQYALDVVGRYGGVRMAIDRNFVDLGTSPTLRRAPAACGRVADRRHYGEVRGGDRGSRVDVLSCLLGRTGHLRTATTGRHDARSRAALERFQRSRGLRVTGRAGDATWTALLASGPRPILKRGSEGPSVRRLQRALTAALPGRVAVHGHFGPGTTAAVARYQRRTGLRVTGVAAPSTWRALQDGETLERRASSGRGKAKGGKSKAKSGKNSKPEAGKNSKPKAKKHSHKRTGKKHGAQKHKKHAKKHQHRHGKKATKRGGKGKRR